MTASQIAMIKEQFDSFRDDMRNELRNLAGRIEAGLSSLEQRIRELEQKEAGCKPVIESRVKAVEEGLKALDVRIREIEGLLPWMKLVVAIGGVLGASVVALIWALITGQATIGFVR